MNGLKAWILSVLIVGLMAAQTVMGSDRSPADISAHDVTCKEALANVWKVREGMKKSEVPPLLGNPARIVDGIWVYDFMECTPPPKVGVQNILGVAITFSDDVISKLDYAAMCVTGPGV
jgi:hypothetical protein